jgi:hypothetical protein
MVKFGTHGCFPSKILLFYRKHDPVVDDVTGAVTSSGIHAIIHSCKYREGTSTKRTEKFHETCLCSRLVAESIPKPLAMMPTMHGPPEKWPKIPLLLSVPVEALDEHVYIIEENPGIQATKLCGQCMTSEQLGQRFSCWRKTHSMQQFRLVWCQ